MNLGKKIHQLRREKGLSQEQLASQITVSRQAVSKWELGETVPDVDNIVQLSKIFGVSTDYLLTDGNDAKTPSPDDASPTGSARESDNALNAQEGIASEPSSKAGSRMDGAVRRFRSMALLAALLALAGYTAMLIVSYALNMPGLGFGLHIAFLVAGALLLAAFLAKIILNAKADTTPDAPGIWKMRPDIWRAFLGAASVLLLAFFLALPLFAVRNVALNYVPESLGDIAYNLVIPELNAFGWTYYVMSIPTMILAACVALLPVFLILRKKLGFFSVEHGFAAGLIQSLMVGVVFVLHVIDAGFYGLVVAFICLAVFVFVTAYYAVRTADRTSRYILLAMSLRNLLLAFPLLLLAPLARYLADLIGDSLQFTYPLVYGAINEADILRLISYVDITHIIYTALVLSAYAIIKRRAASIRYKKENDAKTGVIKGASLKMKGLFVTALAAILLIGCAGIPNLWLPDQVEMIDDLFVDPLRARADGQDMLPRRVFDGSFSELYSFRDRDGYFYEIGIPSSLGFNGFGGFISVNHPGGERDFGGRLIALDGFAVSIMFHPRISGDWHYVLSLNDISSGAQSNLRMGAAVDRDGTPLGRHPEDTEEFYQKWLGLYRDLHEPIMELIAHIKDVFGESAFR